MSILTTKTVRSAIVVTFAMSAMFVGNHERVLRQQQEKQQQQQVAASGPCYIINGIPLCP